MSYSRTVTQNFRAVENRADAETALAAGRLFVEMRNGNFWRCRRNGKTQTWKTRPNDFRVPIKAGLKVYGNVEHDNLAFFRVEIDA